MQEESILELTVCLIVAAQIEWGNTDILQLTDNLVNIKAGLTPKHLSLQEKKIDINKTGNHSNEICCCLASSRPRV